MSYIDTKIEYPPKGWVDRWIKYIIYGTDKEFMDWIEKSKLKTNQKQNGK